jgi:hypothetical protein
MFQQNKAPGYMQELDAWIEGQVINRIFEAREGEEEGERLGTTELILVEVKKAIREKVLESYHSGQAAGPSKGRRYDTR